MDKRGWMMMRVFINRYNPKAGDALLKFLPKEEMQVVLQQDIRSTDLTPILHQPEKLVKQMHHSWIKPLLKKFPDELLPVVGASLTPEQAVGLQIPLSPASIAPLVKTFIINNLYHQLEVHDLLPLDYLPETEFSILAKWTKSQLMLLIDFLGLYDLATEVRRIVNRDYLKNIYTCLTPKQFYYLKICLQQKERFTTPKLGIDPTKKNCEQLKQLLHRRGLFRLGRGLHHQHPDLIWYLAHKLDTGRGKILMNEFQASVTPTAESVLKGQILNLMNFLKPELNAL